MNYIKIFFVACFLVFLLPRVYPQKFDMPESIVYDKANSRYLISDKGDNTGFRSIMQMDLDGSNVDYFVKLSFDERPNAVEISGDTLFVATEKPSVIGFLLSDASRVFDKTFGPADGIFNGLSADGNGLLYLSDARNNIVYQVDHVANSYKKIASGGININGVRVDKLHNRLLLCGWGNPARVYSLDLDTYSVSTLYSGKKNEVYNIDGVGIDACNNYYISLWSAGKIMVFEDGFNNEPRVFLSNLAGPADIDVNAGMNYLLIPELQGENVQLIDLSEMCDDNTGFMNMHNDDGYDFIYPNPADDYIRWDKEIIYSKATLYSDTGSLVAVFALSENINELSVGGLSPGVYSVVFVAERGGISTSMFIKR